MSQLKRKILFVCIHNSARSQMAEAFLKYHGKGLFEVESAGLEPGKLNPNVIEVMKRKGIDISGNPTKSVFDLFNQGKLYDVVVTVCDQASAESCPIFPGNVKRIAWSFSDPSSFTGSGEEILAQTAMVRDQIEQQVESFIEEAKDFKFWN